MSMERCLWSDEDVARNVQEAYAKHAKNAASTKEKSEWTVLAGIVLLKERGELETVSFGAGTQCVGLARIKQAAPGTVTCVNLPRN